jgi:hypothetical protein
VLPLFRARQRPAWVIADAGDEGKGPSWNLKARNGWKLKIVERSFAGLRRHRKLSKYYEFRVQTSKTFITTAACTRMLRRIAPE